MGQLDLANAFSCLTLPWARVIACVLFLFLNQVKEERIHEHPLAWDTLQGFPKVELSGKIVLVRWDLSIFHKGGVIDVDLPPDAVSTILYLITCDARIIIASHWSPFQSSNGMMDYQMIAGVSHFSLPSSCIGYISNKSFPSNIQQMSIQNRNSFYIY